MEKNHKWQLGKDGRSVFCECHGGRNRHGETPYHYRMFHMMPLSEMERRMASIRENDGLLVAQMIAKAIAAWWSTSEGQRWRSSRLAKS